MPKLFPFQQEAADSDAHFKQLNWGRRTGKTRGMLTMATTGHGPLVGQERLFRGLAQGGTVLWVSLDYKQLKTIWREDIQPRWGAADLPTNAQDWEAQVGEGRLIMRSAENPGNIRGAGKGLTGVILDEGAHWDVQTVMEDILLPILLDEDAWLIMASTPNAGSDGRRDEDDQRVTPSYFNRQAKAILDGTQPDWGYWHADARLNPKIKARAWERLLAQYPEGSLKLRQEVFAELLTGGAGFAFPEMAKHIHQQVRKAQGELVVGMDWGYAKPGWLGVIEPTRRGAHLHWELPFNGSFHPPPFRLTPVSLVRLIVPAWKELVRTKVWPRMPTTFYVDSAMGSKPDAGESIIDQMAAAFEALLGEHAPLIVPVPKGPGSRVQGKMLFHTLLDYRQSESEQGLRVLTEAPRLTADPRCTEWWNTVSSLVTDEKDPEDVDTTGNDHPYDGSRYALMAIFPELLGRKIKVATDAEIAHLDKLSRRAHREYEDEVAKEIARIKAARRGSGRHYG